MTINLSLPENSNNLRPRITVFGVGGAGGNAVNNMIESNLEGVDFIVANTDAQALDHASCERKIQLGLKNTKGLGAGMRPDIGREAAEEVMEELNAKLEGINMVFIAAGMGGGTGTGASPVIAKLAREKSILTVGVITTPFHFEGTQRMKIAKQGIDELQQYVDTLLTIPNQNLFKIANEKTTFSDAFKMADDVLYAGVRGVTDLIVQPGLINLDFSDIQTVMSEMGKAMMGTGQAKGDTRAVDAAEAAIANPLIDDVSLNGAKGLIINITGGKDLTLYEVDEAANRVKKEVKEDANIIYGTTCDERLEGAIRVSIIATGIDSNIDTNANFRSQPILSINNDVYKQTASENFNTSHSENINAEENVSKISHEENRQDSEINLNEDHVLDNSVNPLPQENLESLESNNLESTENVKDLESGESKEDTHHELNEYSLKNQNSDDAEDSNQVRKLGLFDSLSDSEIERKEIIESDNQKSEPVLSTDNSSLEYESEDISIESTPNDSELKKDDSYHQETHEEDMNQDDHQLESEQEEEEDLLDIPTFLRRQAN